MKFSNAVLALTKSGDRLPAMAIKSLQRTVRRAQHKLLRLIAPRDMVPTALEREHPLNGSIADAWAYNAGTRQSVLDGNRVINFATALGLVRNLPTGDYAELGTYQGKTAKIIWRGKAAGATLHCFDTFSGFDKSELGDARLKLDVENEAFTDTSPDAVRRAVAGGDHPELRLHVGYFPATFAGCEDLRFRLVHLDMDLAEPIAAGLEHFWPRLVDGGILLVHDYRSARYPMCAEAVDAFFAARGIAVWPLNDRLGTAMVIRQPGMPD